MVPHAKGVANLGRYHQVGRRANGRYLDALAAAHDNRAGVAVLHRHTTTWRGFGPAWPVSTPSSGSATPTLPAGFIPNPRPPAPRPDGAASEPPG
ncbi:MAG: hypothetical protein ACRD1K_07840 [Acidimicrobiales bacterium]